MARGPACLLIGDVSPFLPLATAAVFANNEWIRGTRNADCGHEVVNISGQPVALATLTSGLALSMACRAASASRQP
ncbi:hypothetical protein KO516_19770 [Citreicella sp. C3M06]|uniref:hypothetical protein n=1 Tax=Citreicella sp. C3M06 TaxID=2841564 RepID=UPI001C08CA4A|nr:hypothetical protein [Citreicella sp. C3M06]MBU2963027.1 hypothetical protein [Citreicella sp. C3M06]